MNRGYALAIGTIAVVGIAFVSGASVARNSTKPADDRIPAEGRPPIAIGQKTAVFNMAGVMRDFNYAKYQVWLLNKKKEEIYKPVLGWRSEHSKIEAELKENPDQPKKGELEQKIRDLARKIEDVERKLTQQLNEDASAIISDLYDMIKEVVNQTAEQNGFQIVFAYPDAVSPEELKSAYIKELKLKPPAAQPFYVAPGLDISARIIKTLNEKHPPIDPVTKQPVDVSGLPALTPGASPMPNVRPQISPSSNPIK
ncbi:OmpH family outer membrane protein [Gemmata sp. G18]|uniref:OmpH family outer membrane protein n=1 Tax=Gemmata palustris TaxID=2822762 RepID=A0ABS5BZ79_9BACT|nr:OmpH family outer membrane protein [Gemmata palustris]MBP3958953.1 OmpH family outer membrane protein [Gemmata palustris]